VLWIYDAVKDPGFTALLLAFVPFRFVVLQATVSSEPLFLCYVHLAFIFLKTNRTTPLFLSIAGACVTRFEGLALWGTVGLCYCLRLDFFRAAVIGMDLLAVAAVCGLHRLRFGDWAAFWRYSRGPNCPFDWPDMVGKSDSPALPLFAVFGVGSALLAPVALPFALFAVAYFAFAASVRFADVWRYAAPGYVFALLVGLDGVWASAPARRALRVIALPTGAAVLWCAVAQIAANAARPKFMRAVFGAEVTPQFVGFLS
jgi:hypothetical protein